jgi:hypothetical protein
LTVNLSKDGGTYSYAKNLDYGGLSF